MYVCSDRDDAVKALEGVKSINGRKVQVSFATKRQTKKTKRKKADGDNEEECETSAKKLKLDTEDTYKTITATATTIATFTTTTTTTTVPQKYGTDIVTVWYLCLYVHMF